MLSVKLKWDWEAIKAAGFADKLDRVLLLLIEKIDEASNQFRDRVEEKLSGEVLERRSGKLADSVNIIPAVQDGTAIVGGVTAAGGEAFYGIFQELGVEHPWEIMVVDMKALHFLAEGKSIFSRHARHPGLPARSYMESTAEEEHDLILDMMASAVQEGLLSGE